MEKRYKLNAPLGNYVLPKEEMTEKEVRDFAAQLIHEPAWEQSWREKVARDPIESVVEWLKSAGYEVNEL